MKIQLDNEQFVNSIVYYDMPYCFNNVCPRASKCFHYIAAKFKAPNKQTGNAIYPDALKKGKCKYFMRPQIIKVAWGFSKLYDEIHLKDVASMRTKVMSILGGRTSYYRYHRGEKFLKPEQQEAIKKLFISSGYLSPNYDFQKEIVDFTDKE